jgi:hypothetical protein
VFEDAQVIVAQHTPPKERLGRHDIHILDDAIRSLEQRGISERLPSVLLASLVLQSPRAVVAQRKMDKFHHGFHDKQNRLDELIEFNDAYVSLIIMLDDTARLIANDEIKHLMDEFCRRMKSPPFSPEQWEAITHGLSREIAVFLSARELGYQAMMTSRRADAMGVDMVITDPHSRRHLNVDIKTRSSFHFRLEDLRREGRISEMQREAAEHAGYCMVVNGHGDGAVHTTLLRIDEETYGRVINFRLERPEVLGDLFEQIVR